MKKRESESEKLCRIILMSCRQAFEARLTKRRANGREEGKNMNKREQEAMKRC